MRLTDVFPFRPGPTRWKFCVFDRSWTLIVYLPGLRARTDFPALFSTVKTEPGPTAPNSWGSALGMAGAASTSAAATATSAEMLLGMTPPSPLHVSWFIDYFVAWITCRSVEPLTGP